ALASGTVSAFVEATLRKPTYADFMALRDDVQTLKGWWRNRVARILLNFFLTSLGTAIGVWTGGLRMLGQLVGRSPRHRRKKERPAGPRLSRSQAAGPAP